MIAVRLLRNLTSINNEELGAYRCPLTDLEGSPRSVGEGAKQSFQSGGAAVFWKICGPPASGAGVATSPGSRS